MSHSLLEMAKDLVMAQIEAHRLSPDEMHSALHHTYASLQALKVQEVAHGSVTGATPTTPPAPVHWRKSITKYHVTCLECRVSFKQLSGRHLKEHGLDGKSYRIKYGIPRIQPLAAKEITSRRKEIVQRSRPWEKAPMFLKAQEDAHGSVTVATPATPSAPVHWRKSITKYHVTCLECRASFKQLSGRHLREHGLDGKTYRIKYGIPRTQSLAAKEITLRRKEMVQRSRPWEKAPTFVKAQEEKQRKQASVAQRKKTARAKA